MSWNSYIDSFFAILFPNSVQVAFQAADSFCIHFDSLQEKIRKTIEMIKPWDPWHPSVGEGCHLETCLLWGSRRPLASWWSSTWTDQLGPAGTNCWRSTIQGQADKSKATWWNEAHFLCNVSSDVRNIHAKQHQGQKRLWLLLKQRRRLGVVACTAVWSKAPRSRFHGCQLAPLSLSQTNLT